MVAAAGILAASGAHGEEALLQPAGLSAARSMQSTETLVNADVDTDLKVNLQDVIFVLRILNSLDPGPASPGADADGDGRIGLPDALYMLQTIAEAASVLQPYIDAYLAGVPNEQAAEDAAVHQLERTFYRNAGTGPGLKMPTVEFAFDGFDFSVEMSSCTPPDAPEEQIDTVRVLFYDAVWGDWGYGVNQAAATPFLTETPHGDDFSATYDLLIDAIQRLSDGTVKSLGDVDPARGFVLHATTDTGSEFLVGDGAVRIFVASADGRAPMGDGVQDLVASVVKIGVVTGECPCPTVDALSALQASFARQGVSLTADHLGNREGAPLFSCGDTFKTVIRLGHDLEVLESRRKLGKRIQESDFRAVEPAGYFRGAGYLLQLHFYSWWNPAEGVCKCQFSWQLVQVSTARILAADTAVKNCGELASDFDAMLDALESGTGMNLFLLSDADYAIPDCDDGNPCTWDAWDLKTGQCRHRSKAASMQAACDDGDLCTVDDKCINGLCVGTPKVCNDHNPCTNESCDPATGNCKWDDPEANGAPCDDGDDLTENDVCIDGVCAGTLNPDTPLPGVPYATGHPYCIPDPIAGSSDTTTVYVPVTPDSRLVAYRFYKPGVGDFPVVMGAGEISLGTTLAPVQTIPIYTEEGQIYLEFTVQAGPYGGASSNYTLDPTRSETHYTVTQDDTHGHVLTTLSDIPVTWLTVDRP